MKKNIIYLLVFVIVYCISVIITSPFLISWGTQRNILEKAFIVFMGSPLDWGNNMFFIIINGLFWAGIFYAIFNAFKYFNTKN